MVYFFLLVFAYLVGAIPTGILLTKLTGGEDLRAAGSGNIGATNVYRTAGRKLGIITLIGDCLKGILPLLVAMQYDVAGSALALIGFVALIGHCYPVYIGFKGGKGVATAVGVFLVLSPGALLLVLSQFLVVLGKWRYISLASISCAATIPVLVLAIEKSVPMFFISFFIASLVIYRHHENIDRLLAGTENKFTP